MLLIASNRIFHPIMLVDLSKKSRGNGFRHGLFQPLKQHYQNPVCISTFTGSVFLGLAPLAVGSSFVTSPSQRAANSTKATTLI